MTATASGLVVALAWLALIGMFAYLILTDEPASDIEADPLPPGPPQGFGAKLAGYLALAVLLGTSLVMWLDA